MKVQLQYIGTNVHNYIYAHQKPSWLRTIVIHHTYNPTIAQWNGMTTLQGIWKYYQGLGWDSGPHFFVAPEGIYTMTKMEYQGIHANAANTFSYGIEVVGNYDYIQWQEPIKSNALHLIYELEQWAGINDLEPHRKFNPNKSCPGKAITIDWIRQELNKKYMTTYYTVSASGTINIRQQPKVADNNIAATLTKGDYILAGDIKADENNQIVAGSNKWVHVRKAFDSTGADKHLDNSGFVHMSVLSRR